MIVNNLAAPDIVGLEEIQDNNGATGGTGSPVVDANVTLDRLVAAIQAAGGPTYSTGRSTRSPTRTAVSRAGTSASASSSEPIAASRSSTAPAVTRRRRSPSSQARTAPSSR